MTLPTPPGHHLAGGTRPLEHACMAHIRDRDLSNLLGETPVRLVYSPDDPYALSVHIVDWHSGDAEEEVVWVSSREVFVAAGLYELPVPGLDFTVQAVTVTRCKPGGAERDVPVLRMGLYVTDGSVDNDGLGRHTGDVIWLDIDRDNRLAGFLRRTLTTVPPGAEHRFIDVDATIDRLLGR